MREGFLNARDFGASGSEYKTVAHATAGSNVFTLDDIGDFKVGDEVYLPSCNVHLEKSVLFERKDMKARNRRPWKHNQPVLDRAEIRGYDGSQGEWVTYMFDVYPEEPNVFRWTKNYGREWHENLPLKIGEWTSLGDGVEVKINDFKEREWGATAIFVCSSRLFATVEKIEGNEITLSAAANKTCDSEIMHSDSAAIQRAIDAAMAENKNVFLPNGRYRLTKTLQIINPTDFTFEGESGVNTVLDNSLGALGVENQEGSCFHTWKGESVTLRNLFMVGSLGYKDRDMGANLFPRGGSGVFGFYFHKSNATCFESTKRVLVENCHARKMSAECFYSSSDKRENANPPDAYSTEITYIRCSVEDCARNAFNNNDKAEGTSILYCRLKDIGNAAWEGASRMIKIHGCYMCNTGSVAIGNTRHRFDWLYAFGSGQHVITDNYFEGRVTNPKFAMIKIGSIATQITIANNVFVNFNSPAICAVGECQSVDTPPERIIIKGNSIDLTAIDSPSIERYGIKITSNYATIADNHIVVRGDIDENVSGIVLSDDANGIVIHDNTIAGCKVAIASDKVVGKVGDVESDTVFYRGEGLMGFPTKPMLLRPDSQCYKGWVVKWLSDGTVSEIAEFEPYALTFTLKEPRKMQSGDEFYIYSPKALPWSIHHNIIENCEKTIEIDSFVETRAVLDGNIIG